MIKTRILLDDGDDALMRALAKREKGKRLSRKERAIVELHDRLHAEIERRNMISFKIPEGPSYTFGKDFSLSYAVPSELLGRIQKFRDDLVQAAYVAQSGLLVGEITALKGIINDFRRVFARELVQETSDERD